MSTAEWNRDTAARLHQEVDEFRREVAALGIERDAEIARGHNLAKFAEWLLAMDDPNNAKGMASRQTVTLNNIIARAADALGVPRPDGAR